MKYLCVIDFQNDFITGSLANKEAEKIVKPISNLIRNFDGEIILTFDCHDDETYLDTQEGKNLPIKHCIDNTAGYFFPQEVAEAILSNPSHVTAIDKHTFGTLDWGDYSIQKDDEIYICGLCTDICVITNALILKTIFPETPIFVYEDLCAGTTIEKHEQALSVMESCQIKRIKFKG